MGNLTNSGIAVSYSYNQYSADTHFRVLLGIWSQFSLEADSGLMVPKQKIRGEGE